MRKLFFNVVVFGAAISLISCAGEEFEPAPMSAKTDTVTITVPEKEQIVWTFAGSKLVQNETSLENEEVDFTVAIKDSFVAVVSGETVVKDSIRTYKFSSENLPDSWRSLNLSFSKGSTYYQKEFTNSVNLKRKSYAKKDSVSYSYNGWNITREAKTIHVNLVSRTDSTDVLDPVASCNSFFGSFTDPMERLQEVVELAPVQVSVTPSWAMYHHRDLSWVYDEETATWENKSFVENDENPSNHTINKNNKEYMRYPLIVNVKWEVAKFNFSKEASADFEYWVEFNEEEAINNGTATPNN